MFTRRLKIIGCTRIPDERVNLTISVKKFLSAIIFNHRVAQRGNIPPTTSFMVSDDNTADDKTGVKMSPLKIA